MQKDIILDFYFPFDNDKTGSDKDVITGHPYLFFFLYFRLLGVRIWDSFCFILFFTYSAFEGRLSSPRLLQEFSPFSHNLRNAGGSRSVIGGSRVLCVRDWNGYTNLQLFLGLDISKVSYVGEIFSPIVENVVAEVVSLVYWWPGSRRRPSLQNWSIRRELLRFIDAVCGGFMTTHHLHHAGFTVINRGICDPWILSWTIDSFTTLIFEIFLIL